MNVDEKATLAETIDLTVSLAGLTLELRRQVMALKNLVCAHPELEKIYLTKFAEADERGESLYENIHAAARKLAEAKDDLRTEGKGGAL